MKILKADFVVRHIYQYLHVIKKYVFMLLLLIHLFALQKTKIPIRIFI